MSTNYLVIVATACFLIHLSPMSQADDVFQSDAASREERLSDLRERVRRSGAGPDAVRALYDVSGQLRTLVVENGDDDVALEARVDLYQVYLSLAKALLQKSRLALDDAEQKATLKQARKFFDAGAEMCDDASSVINDELEDLDPTAATRRRLITRLVQVQLARATMEEEAAEAAATEKLRLESLQRAANLFHDLHNQRRTTLAGVYARLYESRVRVKLGQRKQALGMLRELWQLPGQQDAFATLKLKVSLSLADYHLQEEDADLTGEAERVRKHLDSLPDALRKGHDARQLRARLKTLQEKSGQDVTVASQDHETATISVGDPEELPELSAEEKSKIADYRMAHADVREKMSAYKTATESVDALERKRDVATSDEARAEAQRALEDAQGRATKLLAEAILACEKMLELGDANARHRPTAQPLYYLGFLHYKTDDYTTALQYSEDLARNQPLASGARQSAKIAAACYMQKYQQAVDPAEKSDLLRHYLAMETYTIKTWPDSAEAESALSRLRGVRKAAEAARQR